jgi:hypothetical protein
MQMAVIPQLADPKKTEISMTNRLQTIARSVAPWSIAFDAP